MAPSLQRFKDAQSQRHSGYETALAEMQAGRKRSHWIWYVFPQLAGLGMSHMSELYGIAGAAEAEAYLRDPDLRERLLTVTVAARDHLKKGVPIDTLMGGEIDAQKLVSSMTLFAAIARKLSAADPHDDYRSIEKVAEEVLAAADREGYPRCAFTMQQLQRSHRSS